MSGNEMRHVEVRAKKKEANYLLLFGFEIETQ